MVQGMQQCTGKSQSSQHLIATSQSYAADANANSNDSDVLDAVIGKQFFEVVLDNGQHHTVQAGDNRYDQDQVSGSNEIRFNQQQHAKNAIDADLDDDT